MTAVSVLTKVSELDDASIVSPARGDRLYWDSVSQTWKNLGADVVSAKVYGSVGDGTLGAGTGTDNTTAIAAAVTAAGSGTVLVTDGLHRTTVAASTLNGPFAGYGRLITTESGPAYNARGKFFNAVKSQPSTLSWPGTGVDDAFNGDFAHAPIVIEHRVSGADTLGSAAQTTSGYFQVGEASPFIGYMSSSSGRSGAGSSGRTGAWFFNVRLKQESGAGGDLAALCVAGVAAGVSTSLNTTATGVQTINTTPSTFAVGSTSGAPASGVFYLVHSGSTYTVTYTSISDSTHFAGCTVASGSVTTTNGDAVTGRWDQNSSVGTIAGALIGGADGVYLDADEITLRDGVGGTTYDVSAVGLIRNFIRTKDTAALAQFWNGIRLQSQGDATHGNLDAGILLYGGSSGYMVGIDLSNANLTASGTYNNAAFTLKANQRIYLNASGTDSGGKGFYRRPDDVGTEFIYYDTTGSKLRLVVGGNDTLQISSTVLTVNGGLSVIGASGLSVTGAGGVGITNGPLNMNSHLIQNLTAGTPGQSNAASMLNTIDQFAALPNNTSLTGLLSGGSAVNLLKIGTTGALFLGDANVAAFVLPNAKALLGLNAAGSGSLNIGQVTSGNIVTYGDTGASGVRIVTDTTIGLTIGTATTQKVAFYGLTPVVQPVAGAGSNFTANSGTAMNSASTSTGGTGSSAYTFPDLVRVLKNLGLIAV